MNYKWESVFSFRGRKTCTYRKNNRVIWYVWKNDNDTTWYALRSQEFMTTNEPAITAQTEDAIKLAVELSPDEPNYLEDYERGLATPR